MEDDDGFVFTRAAKQKRKEIAEREEQKPLQKTISKPVMDLIDVSYWLV